jgi:dephospho-CoA kinase
MIIIGITGTLGAGKGTVVEYLQQKGFRHYSARDLLVKEIVKRGLTVDRDCMVVVANELRSKNSPNYLAEELYREAATSGENAVIESLRTEGEVNALRQKGGFYLIAVDADTRSRYDRIIARGSETDKISFEEFLRHEKREMYSADPNQQNLAKCAEMADHQIFNNGTREQLYTEIDEVLKNMPIQ